MSAWRTSKWLSSSWKLLSSSTAVLLLAGQGQAMATSSLQPKSTSVVATNSELIELMEREPKLPPLGQPSEFLPEGQIVPEVPPAETAAPQEQQTRIVLSLSDRRVYLYDGDKVKASYPVAVGKPGWETPMGEFAVLDKALDPVWENPWTGEIIQPGPDSPLGPAIIVFELSEEGMYAFHGTSNEELIGQAVSHGCVRMRNEDIMAMYELVPLRTAVEVIP
ncbi:MAG: L,D-transpeptidase family protein [Geitlerinemataceae cyanobacterium]